MVNSGIGFQEPLTRPGVKLDEKMSICSSTPQDHGMYTNSSLLESDLRERKCHAMLFFESLYEPNEQFVQRLSLYERKQTLSLNNLTTESTKYALKMLNGRTCVSNQDEKQRLEELNFNESGESERSRTKSKLTSKYGVTRRDREPSRLQCKIVIKMFKKGSHVEDVLSVILCIIHRILLQ